MKNDLSRRKFIGSAGAAGLAAALGTAKSQSGSLASAAAVPFRLGGKKTHVVFVTGDDEYRSEVSMPMIANVLEAHHEMRTSVLYATEPGGKRNPKYQKNIPGLEILKKADLAVFFLRFRALPDEQIKMILDYVNSGRPIVGLRTSTHAFRYPKDHEHRHYNEDFGRDVFGQKWISHEGGRYGTRVLKVLADHPTMRGVEEEFYVRSWLYNVIPLHGDCVTSAIGYATDTDTGGPFEQRHPKRNMVGTPNPVAWTKTYKKSPVFFTTLGHPADFEASSMRRLLVNGIYWALGKDIPEAGTNVDIPGVYTAPEVQ